MLRPINTHEEYQAFVKESLRKQLVDASQTSVLFTHTDLIGKMWLTDLSPGVLVAPCYSTSSRGTPPRDPVCLFRSLLLMHLASYYQHHKVGISPEILPFFAILSDFEPCDVPGVGTFYDFINQL